MIKKKDTNESVVWGSILIGLGIIFLLQRFFDIEILEHIWQFWPIALIVWGVAIIANRK